MNSTIARFQDDLFCKAVTSPNITWIGGRSLREILPIRISFKVCSTLLPQPEKLNNRKIEREEIIYNCCIIFELVLLMLHLQYCDDSHTKKNLQLANFWMLISHSIRIYKGPTRCFSYLLLKTFIIIIIISWRLRSSTLVLWLFFSLIAQDFSISSRNVQRPNEDEY